MNVEITEHVNLKKSYHAPELTALGSIPTVVQGNAGTGTDGAATCCKSALS
jgi:hypothetical protein